MNVTRREFLETGAAAGSAALLAGTLPAAEVSPASAKPREFAVTAKSWPLFRGDSLAQGVSPSPLPEKPDVVWKITIEKGAFDGTPVIDAGVVYIGDMDGKIYALRLDNGKEVWNYKVPSGFIAAPAVRGNLL